MDALGELWLRLPPITMDIGDGQEKVVVYLSTTVRTYVRTYVCMYVYM